MIHIPKSIWDISTEKGQKWLNKYYLMYIVLDDKEFKEKHPHIDCWADNEMPEEEEELTIWADEKIKTLAYHFDGSFIKEQIKRLKESKPLTYSSPYYFPLKTWNACWDGKRFDFTHKEWKRLKFKHQYKFSQLYQKWYAYSLKEDTEKTIGGFPFILVPPGKINTSPIFLDDQISIIEVDRHFWIGKYPVLYDQLDTRHFWLRQSPEWSIGPIQNVSWFDCNAFCDSKFGYYLPYTHQWEYACRAGSTGSFNFADDTNIPHSNLVENTSKHKWKVAGPNAWGGFGFHGTIYQWCFDGNESGPVEVKYIKGGCKEVPLIKCTSSFTGQAVPTTEAHIIGFRVCID